MFLFLSCCMFAIVIFGGAPPGSPARPGPAPERVVDGGVKHVGASERLSGNAKRNMTHDA